MKKQSVRSFAIGMLLSVCVIGSYYYYAEEKNDQKETPINVKEATSYLHKEGFIVLSDAEYTDLQKSVEKRKQDQTNVNEETKEKKQEDQKKSKPKIYTYSLKVNNGMSISSIAALLSKEKIVKDQQEFETYLIDNDYHTKIQVGSFRLTSEMTFKQIAETLTK